MDIIGTDSLWKDYAAAALPLNASALSDKTENDVRVREFYFDGFTTVDGRVRAYLKIYERAEAIGTALFLVDQKDRDTEDQLSSLFDRGYTVAVLDYLGVSDVTPRFSIYPKSLEHCNARNTVEFDAPDDALNSCWFVWTCMARRAVRLIGELYPDKLRFAIGDGLGAATVFKLAAFPEDGLTGVAILHNALPAVTGTGNPIINYRAALENTAYAPLTKVPMLAVLATNAGDGSFDDMTALAANTASLKCMRIIKRAFYVNADRSIPQICDFFEDCAQDDTSKYPVPQLKAVNSENNLYFNITLRTADGEYSVEDDDKVRLYAAFCVKNPRYRNWTKIPLIRLSDGEYMATAEVVQSDKPVYAFVNLTDARGRVSSSQLLSMIPKSLGISGQPTVHQRRIYDGSLGKDVWISPSGKDVRVASGPYGIEGVSSDDNVLCTLKPGDELYRAEEDLLLQIIASGEPCDLNISVHDEDEVYSCTVNIPNSDEWHKFTLSLSDFKSASGPLADWSRIVALMLSSDESFIVSSVLWV